MTRIPPLWLALTLTASALSCDHTIFTAADYVGTWRGADATFSAVTLQVTPAGGSLLASLSFTVSRTGAHMGFPLPTPALVSDNSLVFITGDDGWAPVCANQSQTPSPVTWFTASARPVVFTPGIRALQLHLTVLQCSSLGPQAQSDTVLYQS